MQRSLKIVLAGSEWTGLARTGGLGDVLAGLPPALAGRGHECVVFLPFYHAIRIGPFSVAPTEHRLQISLGEQLYEGRLWRTTLPDCAVPIYLVEQAELFDRDNPLHGLGLYQFVASDGTRRDYPDNCARFAFFCRAILEALPLLHFWPDILHLHDWQTGLVPVYLREMYAQHPDTSLRSHYQAIRTLFTFHNLAYQGRFPPTDLEVTGLPWKLFNYQQLEFYDRLNLLKGALVFSDFLSTVSPTYVREVQTPYFGEGLHTVLRERQDRLFGILNGIDTRRWDPATDPHLPAHYHVDQIDPGKSACKAFLQKTFGLPAERQTPLLGVVSRLVEHKGIGLLVQALPDLLDQGCQVVILGEGDLRWHQALQDLHQRHTGRLGLRLLFDDKLAHQIEAGADLFLMPSLYEPSGLSQLYSMKYGTVPVVRATGGLADTVVDCTAETLAAGTATGFCFRTPSARAFLEALHRALTLFRHAPERWRALMQQGMRQDWSWVTSAESYERLYSVILNLEEANASVSP